MSTLVKIEGLFRIFEKSDNSVLPAFRRPDSRVKKILRSNTITAENQPPKLKIPRKSAKRNEFRPEKTHLQAVSPKSYKSSGKESLDDLDSGAFSGSDHVLSPFVRPKNPDLPSSVRTKISIAQLFATEPKSPTSLRSNNLDRISSFSECSIDSTFFIETKKKGIIKCHF